MTPEQAIVPPFLRRVVIRNYKSIASCDVWLKPRTFVVGRNGAGKSNFLDALHFIAEALQTSVDEAIGRRGGFEWLRRREANAAEPVSIRLEFGLPFRKHCDYELALSKTNGDGLPTIHERVNVYDSSGRANCSLQRDGNEAAEIDTPYLHPPPLMPPVRRDRLYLSSAAGWPEIQEPHDALLSMGFYRFDPDVMREVRASSAGDNLKSDGSNIANVLGNLEERDPATFARVTRYLTSIVPEIKAVEREVAGPGETVAFLQEPARGLPPSKFYAKNMSDGTLRVLGILVAANQISHAGLPMRLVGIEEPETALHPAAAGALMDALAEATEHTQVILTTHSGDLLDLVDLKTDALLVVTSQGGVSHIGQADSASLEAVRRNLYTPGELLRMDQLQTSAP
jgi:predicted ATPase